MFEQGSHGKEASFRLAAIDGVTPWRAKMFGAVDAARWASGVVRTELHGPGTIAECLSAANGLLHDAGVSPSQCQAAAAVAAVDVTVTASRLACLGVVAGDCEVWIQEPLARDAGVFRRLVGGPATQPVLQQHLDAWNVANPGASDDVQQEFESSLLELRSAWCCPAVGRFSELELASGYAENLTSVVLGSDGAELAGWASAGFPSLDDWLAERARASRDDLTCIQLLPR